MWWTVELFENWIVGVFSFKVYYMASRSPVQKKKRIYLHMCPYIFPKIPNPDHGMGKGRGRSILHTQYSQNMERLYATGVS